MKKKKTKKKSLLGTILAAFLVIILSVTLVAAWFVTSRYVIVDQKLYPKGQQTLDLRGHALTLEEYEQISRKLPGTWITWSVPLSSGTVSSDVTSLTVTSLTDADVTLLPYLTDLQQLDGTGCRDYPQLAAAVSACPEVQVRYNVPIAGQVIASDAVSVTVTSLTQADAQLLACLPRLQTVDATACRDYTVLSQLKADHPGWQVLTTSAIAGQPLDAGAQTATFTGAGYQELSVGLAAMPDLKELTLKQPAASGEELQLLRQEYPNVSIHWEVSIAGQTWTDTTTELDISAAPLTSISQAKAYAAYFPALEKLIAENGDVSYDEMAEYREEVRSDYLVVWTVVFSAKYSVRTDETAFYPRGVDMEVVFRDEHTAKMKYLEDMVCVDIGDYEGIRDISFAAYMPHLKYLILANTNVQDISALANHTELIYLELDHDIISDYTPLQTCTALEDLNISDRKNSTCAGIEPLLTCTWLKTIWISPGELHCWNYSHWTALEEALPNTRVEHNDYSSKTGMGWRNLQNYYDMRDYLGAPYMD